MHHAYDRCKKVNECNFNRNWPHQRIEIGRLRTPFHRFWGEFRRPLAALDRCTLNKGAFAFKIVRGALKWPLKGGSRLIEVAATAGLTVVFFLSYSLSAEESFFLQGSYRQDKSKFPDISLTFP